MPRKPRDSLNTLAQLWDSAKDLREVVRSEKKLLLCDGPVFHATVKSCSQNWEPIYAALHLTKETLTLPEVTPLMAQIANFYRMNGLQPADDQVYREAWGLKAACGLVKRKGRRHELSKDPNFHKLLLVYFPELEGTISNLDLSEPAEAEEKEEEPHDEDLALDHEEDTGDSVDSGHGAELENLHQEIAELEDRVNAVESEEIADACHPGIENQLGLDSETSSAVPASASGSVKPLEEHHPEVPSGAVEGCTLRKATPLNSSLQIEEIESDDDIGPGGPELNDVDTEIAWIKAELQRRAQNLPSSHAALGGMMVVDDSLPFLGNIDAVETQPLAVEPAPSPPKQLRMEVGVGADQADASAEAKTLPKATNEPALKGSASGLGGPSKPLDEPTTVLSRRDQLKTRATAQTKNKKNKTADDADPTAGPDRSKKQKRKRHATSKKPRGQSTKKPRGRSTKKARGRSTKRAASNSSKPSGKVRESEVEVRESKEQVAGSNEGTSRKRQNKSSKQSETKSGRNKTPKTKAAAKAKAKATAKEKPKASKPTGRGRSKKDQSDQVENNSSKRARKSSKKSGSEAAPPTSTATAPPTPAPREPAAEVLENDLPHDAKSKRGPRGRKVATPQQRPPQPTVESGVIPELLRSFKNELSHHWKMGKTNLKREDFPPRSYERSGINGYYTRARPAVGLRVKGATWRTNREYANFSFSLKDTCNIGLAMACAVATAT
ncbi:unnamed protein product [Durusdinium trenchii]|uniref:Uncharacterized protein n=1 Tax=Durusdinium trenchii TaxID=1381693 RepID=A0ABP0NGH3_9DINO